MCSPRRRGCSRSFPSRCCTAWCRGRSTWRARPSAFKGCSPSGPRSGGATSWGSVPRSWTSCPRSSLCSSSPSVARCTFTRRGRSPRFRSAVSPLAKLVEAALFASARPLTVEELLTLDPQAGAAAVRGALAELRDGFAAGDHGVELIEIAQGWQFLTRREYAETLDRAQFALRPRRLSPAADRKSTRLNSRHSQNSHAGFCFE